MATPSESGIPESMAALATPLDVLELDPRNARKHDDRNMAAVRDSLRQFGWRGVVVAHRQTKVVLAGNARVIAARELDMTHAPVLWVEDSSVDSLRYALADNRTAELATWDFDVLSDVLEDIGDITVPGFSEDELDSLLFVPDAVTDDTTDRQELEELNDKGHTEMEKRNTWATVRCRVPKKRAADFGDKLAELVNDFGGEVL